MENQGKKLKVLVVDDNRAILMSIKEHLSEKFDVATATNPSQAMNWLKQENFPDLIISDRKMDEDPDSGMKFLKNIRSSGFFSTIPILILSGTGDSEDSETRIKFLEAGADNFMLKPFNPQELVWRVIAIMRTAGKISYTAKP